LTRPLPPSEFYYADDDPEYGDDPFYDADERMAA